MEIKQLLRESNTKLKENLDEFRVFAEGHKKFYMFRPLFDEEDITEHNIQIVVDLLAEYVNIGVVYIDMETGEYPVEEYLEALKKTKPVKYKKEFNKFKELATNMFEIYIDIGKVQQNKMSDSNDILVTDAILSDLNMLLDMAKNDVEEFKIGVKEKHYDYFIAKLIKLVYDNVSGLNSEGQSDKIDFDLLRKNNPDYGKRIDVLEKLNEFLGVIHNIEDKVEEDVQ